MALNASQRIALESSINSAISNIPNFLDKWNRTSAFKKYQIEDFNEFLYGYILGIISNSLHNIIFISEGRMVTREENLEAEEMILRRLPEIRNSILTEIYYHRTQ
jgi:hypothetical protein